MSSGKTCYYKILQLEKDASPDQIRKAYLKLSLKFHPDKNPDPEAEQYFKDISEAYQVLKDPESKEIYDKYGFSGGPNGENFNFSEFAENLDPRKMFRDVFGTDDVGEAIANIMKDKELRGPVLMGIGGAVAVGGMAAIVSSFTEGQQNSRSRRSASQRSSGANLKAGLGIGGFAAGLLTTAAGAGLYLFDTITTKKEEESAQTENKIVTTSDNKNHTQNSDFNMLRLTLLKFSKNLEKIRNIGIAAHIDAGKTSITELELGV